MLHRALDDAFADLLSRFRAHDDLRRAGEAPLARLARARIELDAARSNVHRLRQALHPYGNDLDLIGRTVLCERLDEVVHIPRLDVTRSAELEWFVCVCGEWVERPIEVSPRMSPRARV